MRYCTRCLMPSTKPHLTFDAQGVCSACRSHERKCSQEQSIDWEKRREQFDDLVRQAREAEAPHYDVLVPVSGGKDSITQVHHLLGKGLRILAVNIDYGIKTGIGVRNLNRIPEMGASLFTFRPQLELHKQLIRIGFMEHGDPDLMSHTLLHAGPLHVALQFEIPLVLLGENSAFEYGGDADLAELNHITRQWFSKYAANNGRDARYVSREYGIPFEHLTMYDFPDKLVGSGTRTAFCSYYFPWDSEKHLGIARKYGFETLDGPGEGTYRNYVGIDEIINRIHQYFKVLKFGYGRATDHACEDIRKGRISREQGKQLVREHDLRPLSRKYIDSFCDFIGITAATFQEVMEGFRNEAIWKRDSMGQWRIPGHLEDE